MLPTVLASSVVRSSQPGEAHGGLYLVNLESGDWKQVLSWDQMEISWDGRGGERGLRGLAFWNGMVVAASSDEIHFLDRDEWFLKHSIENAFFDSIHEICIADDTLYVASTMYDSVIQINLLNQHATPYGFSYRNDKLTHFSTFDEGVEKHDCHHINNVFVANDEMYFSGANLEYLMRVDPLGNIANKVVSLPRGTHNVQPYGKRLIYNDTDRNRIIISDWAGNEKGHFDIPELDDIEYADSEQVARPQFGRGLCMHDGMIIAGSSPACISVYERQNPNPITWVQLSKDVRNCIHGLEVYPYA